MNETLFRVCRQFYLTYPQIHSTVSNEFITSPEVLVRNLSFSHIREIMVIDDAFERFFYETECIKCNWSVRELRRQIKTNLYIRAGIYVKGNERDGNLEFLFITITNFSITC